MVLEVSPQDFLSCFQVVVELSNTWFTFSHGLVDQLDLLPLDHIWSQSLVAWLHLMLGIWAAVKYAE